MPLRKSDHAFAKARNLRRAMSLPEVLLWRELRRQASGLKIRRQHPVGPYVLDFYCAAAKLGIEVDGASHDMGERPQRDVSRDAFLAEQGIAVMRVPAADVLRCAVRVAESVAAACRVRMG